MEETKVVEGKYQGTRGARITKRWEPKEWLPIYEAIVALSCTGLSNEEVGKRFGYGKQQVSNILNTPQGKKLKQVIRNRVNDANIQTIAQRVANLQDNALKRVETIINDEDMFDNMSTAAKMIIFDKSLAVLKSGILKEQGPATPMIPGSGAVQNIDKAIFMQVTSSQADQVAEGLMMADRAKALHSGESSK